MADDNDLERTEPASPRQRLGKAREEGPVAHSHEFTTFTVLVAASGSLWVIGSIIIQKLSAVLESGLRIEQAVAFNSALLLPPMLSGWLFSSKALFPDFKRINPANGFKRIFSSRGLIEPLKTIVKAVIIGGVATHDLGSQTGCTRSDWYAAGCRVDQHGPIGQPDLSVDCQCHAPFMV